MSDLAPRQMTIPSSRNYLFAGRGWDCLIVCYPSTKCHLRRVTYLFEQTSRRVYDNPCTGIIILRQDGRQHVIIRASERGRELGIMWCQHVCPTHEDSLHGNIKRAVDLSPTARRLYYLKRGHTLSVREIWCWGSGLDITLHNTSIRLDRLNIIHNHV